MTQKATETTSSGDGLDEPVEDQARVEKTTAPKGAAAPNEKETRSGETSFRQQWLVENAFNMLGCPPHTAVGAFHGWNKEYVTVDEAKKRIETFGERITNVDPLDAAREAVS